MVLTMPQASNRFFAFGCSATRSLWPTWADILGRQYASYENWGRAGSGNQFIFNSVIECNQRNKFTPNDTVMIMWSSTGREDRYVEAMGGWVGQGNIYNQALYAPSWVNKFACNQGYLIRDLALITATAKLLDSWNVSYEFLCTNNINTIKETSKTIQSPALELYANIIDKIKPGIWDIIYQGDLTSRNDDILRKQFLWFENYNNFAGNDWPEFDKFLTKDYTCSVKTQQEIDKFIKHNSDFPTHNVPHEYLEYLDIVLPNSVNPETRDWVSGLRRNQAVEESFYHNNVPKRFNVNL